MNKLPERPSNMKSIFREVIKPKSIREEDKSKLTKSELEIKRAVFGEE